MMSVPGNIHQASPQNIDGDNEQTEHIQKCISEAEIHTVFHADDAIRHAFADNFENPVGAEEGMDKSYRKGKAAVVSDIAKLRRYDERGVYSRKELEAMRFLNLEGQMKKWIEVYSGLGIDVQKEYDGLLRSATQKKNLVNFDPRQQLGKARSHVSSGGRENAQKESTNLFDPVTGCPIGNENEDSFVEGEDNDYDDSDDDYSSIQRPAFFVAGEPDFDSGPPEDGFEYIRRVRWEAEHMPKVKVSKFERSKLNKEQSVYMPNIPDIASCPEHLLPLKEWEDEFLADFSQLRLALSKLEGSGVNIPSSLPIVSTHHDQVTEDIIEYFDSITSGDDQGGQSDVGEDNVLKNSWPTLSVISGMEPVTRVSVLRKKITAFESATTVSRDDCLWLFGLCAAVDTPLHAETSAALRSLLRKCASLRAEKTMVDEDVIMLNILATISGRYFGQAEK
ncbi:hypothetical protein DM860_016102 [Cuscuta australis]|uniref:Gem-associated protein 2 n=1 Tax=Cuscuta australis TaxID=267555 RepID=A0A328E704_9ASTE|nr:hypothetical protein DM860_016102 [Cuscuta australis]